jgi:hypothetical protein
MCLSRSGTLTETEFKIKDLTLEEVKTYNYLGVKLANCVSFKEAEADLTQKAMKALFKLKSMLHDTNLSPSTCIKLFDQLIRPICHYASEIWGLFNIRIPPKDITGKLESSLENFKCEKLNLSFARYVLGVHKKAQNSAVRGELGRLPLGVHIIPASLNYLSHLKKTPQESLLHQALITSQSLTTARKTWGKTCKQLEQYLRVHTNLKDDKSLPKTTIKSKVRNMYIEYWKHKISNEAKMRTYNLFKQAFVYEDYLAIKHPHHRKSLTRLRISAHRLSIERGRYTTPKTPVSDRKCQKCNLNEVEDEFHFIIKCPFYAALRQQIFMEITLECPNFHHQQDQHKFQYLLSSGGNVAKKISKFIHESTMKRESVV